MGIYAFYKAPGTWKDKIVRFADGRGPYSHVEVLRRLPNSQRKAVSIGASKRDGNVVRIKEIEFKPGHWDFVQTQKDTTEVWSRAIKMQGAHYDTIGAFFSITPIAKIVRNKTIFCSEMVAMLEGLPNPGGYAPNEIYKELIHRGGRKLSGVG